MSGWSPRQSVATVLLHPGRFGVGWFDDRECFDDGRRLSATARLVNIFENTPAATCAKKGGRYAILLSINAWTAP